MNTIAELMTLNPCPIGLEYAKKFSTLAEAWDNCENSSWMWWFIRKRELYTKELCITYSKQCAEHVKHLRYYSDAAAADAAADAAYTADDAAYTAAYAVAYAAAYAAAADAYAAAAADAAVYAVTYAAAVDAAYTAAYAVAYAAERKWQANLLRTLVPNPFLVATEGEK